MSCAMSGLLAMAAVVAPANTQTQVYVMPGATPLLQHAAAEFAAYSSKLLGQEVRVQTGSLQDVPAGAGFVVIIDTDATNVDAVMNFGARRFVPHHREGFCIVGRPERPQLLISGRADRGTLYGVYHYLETQCHVGFFKDGEHIPRLKTLPIPESAIVEAPRYQQRALGAGVCWGCFHPHTDQVRRRHVNWCAKKKANDGYPHCPRTELLDIRPFVRGDGFLVGQYDYKLPLSWPRAIAPDGFSNWRGPRYYGNTWYVEDPDDAEMLARRLYADRLKDTVPEGAPHVYRIAWSSEAGEWEHLGRPMLERGCRLTRERDPRARFILEAYSFGSPDELYRSSLPLLVQDNTSGDWSIVPSRRAPGSVATHNFYYGKEWVFTAGLAGSDQQISVMPSCKGLFRDARVLVTDPRYSNCIGMTLHADNLSVWFQEDLYGELAWNPARWDYESWTRDLCLRRFGAASLENMTRSFRRFLDTADRTHIYGYNRYKFHYEILWHFNETYWHGNIARDWHMLVDGTRDIREFREALESALGEKERQEGNRLYDLYLITLFRPYCAQLFKYPLIRLHSHYYQATRALGRGDAETAGRHIAAFETEAPRLDLVLEQLARVVSTREEWCLTPVEHWTKKQKHDYFRFQNWMRDGFELIEGIYRPAVQFMIEEERKRLRRGETRLIEHSMVEPWWPGPDPYYYYPAAKDEEARRRELAIVENFIEQPFSWERSTLSTAEAVEAALAALDAAGCTDFPDMRSAEMIATNYRLSDERYRPWSHQPVRRARGQGPGARGQGPWAEEFYIVEPAVVGAQTVYPGPYVGAWTSFRGKPLEVEFTYRNASTAMRAPDTDVSSVTISVMVGQKSLIALNFFNNGHPQPTVEVLGEPLSQKQLALGPKADNIRPRRQPAGRPPGPAEPATAAHHVHIRYDGDSLQVGGGPFDGTAQFDAPLDVYHAAILITSFYPEYGPAPEVWIRDLKLNGRPVELFTDEWPH